MFQENKNDARVDGSFILTTEEFIGQYPLKSKQSNISMLTNNL